MLAPCATCGTDPGHDPLTNASETVLPLHARYVRGGPARCVPSPGFGRPLTEATITEHEAVPTVLPVRPWAGAPARSLAGGGTSLGDPLVATSGTVECSSARPASSSPRAGSTRNGSRHDVADQAAAPTAVVRAAAGWSCCRSPSLPTRRSSPSRLAIRGTRTCIWRTGRSGSSPRGSIDTCSRRRPSRRSFWAGGPPRRLRRCADPPVGRAGGRL